MPRSCTSFWLRGNGNPKRDAAGLQGSRAGGGVAVARAPVALLVAAIGDRDLAAVAVLAGADHGRRP
eukprot:7058093-Lingulodinium_polyedra.AAC.1